MPRGIDPQFCKPPVQRTMPALFQTLEVSAHLISSPALVAGEVCDRIPIRVVWINQNHRVVRRASAQSARARVQHAFGLGMAGLPTRLSAVGIMPDAEVPFHRVVLRSECIKRGYVVVGREAVDIRLYGIAARQLARVAAGFEQD